MVGLVLTLDTAGPGGLGPTTRRLESGRLTIGRGGDSDWVLDDPERELSRRHCVIERRDGRYWLMDTSANGVFVNGAAQALGDGGTHPLADGDRLRLGSHTLTVRFEDDRPAAGAADDGRQAFGPDVPVVPAEDPSSLFDTTFGSAGRRPTAAQPEPEPAASRGLFDTAFGAEHELGPPERARPADDPGRAAFDDDWPFAAADESGGLWPDEPEERKPAGPATPPDHGAVEHDFFEPPRAVERRRAPDRPEARSAAPEPPRAAAPPVEPPSRPVRPARADVADPLAAFLRGAGIDPAAVADSDPEALMEGVGETFREAAEGLRTVLIARAMVKREARLGQTVIAARNNNPLKFAATAEEALLALLRPKGPGYLPPAEAVRAGFDDIKVHQLAVLAGLRAALDAVLARFDPEELEGQLRKRSPMARLMPGSRKAKYWKLFVQEYRAIARDAEHSFRGAFGHAFADAYERQMNEQMNRR